MIFKSEADWDEHDKKMAQLNARVVNIPYCALDVNEFNRIFICTSTKKIWDRLEVTHKGTNQVKESKINMLVHTYEMFKMEPSETISDIYTRFTNIINSLKSLRKVYTNQELVNKILRSLLASWDTKVTVIQETKVVDVLFIEQLIGSLMTYELSLK